MFGDIRYARVCYKQGGIKGLNTIVSGRGQGNYRGVRFPMPVRVRVRDGRLRSAKFNNLLISLCKSVCLRTSRHDSAFLQGSTFHKPTELQVWYTGDM